MINKRSGGEATVWTKDLERSSPRLWQQLAPAWEVIQVGKVPLESALCQAHNKRLPPAAAARVAPLVGLMVLLSVPPGTRWPSAWMSWAPSRSGTGASCGKGCIK